MPPIYVQPSVAGTYPIIASWAFTYTDNVPGTATAILPMRVTVPLVPATLLTRTTTAENSGMTTTQLTFSNPQGGAAAERLYYVVNNGNLRYWGALVGITNHTGAGTASVSNNAIANVHSSLHGIWSARDGEITLNDANVGGGMFITRSNGVDTVYSWRATGAAPTVRLITAPSGGWGTIRQVQSRWRSNYVLSTAGLYYISPITGTTGGGAVTRLNIDPATIRTISAYGNFSDYAGVIAVTTTGGVLRANRGVSTMTTLKFATGEVARVAERHGPYTFILTESGKVIWRYLETGTWQTGFSTFGTGAAGTSPVLSMSTWRKSDYAGGTLLHADGSVTVFIRLAGATIANGTAYNYSPAKFGNSPVVNTFASDGSFLALTQNGTLWGWGGNPDLATKGEPEIKVTNVSNAMIWGWHRGNGQYLGGGFATTTLGTCSF